MDWYSASGEIHQQTFSNDGLLSSLPQEREREVAALWRLQADVNNGAYLQFLGNWGRESYEYASRGLKRIHAGRTAALIETCQALVDEHLDCTQKSYGDLYKELPESVSARILELSYEFMDYPDDLPTLAIQEYGKRLVERRGEQSG